MKYLITFSNGYKCAIDGSIKNVFWFLTHVLADKFNGKCCFDGEKHFIDTGNDIINITIEELDGIFLF